MALNDRELTARAWTPWVLGRSRSPSRQSTCRALLVAVATLCGAVLGGAGRAEVIISEIMYNPDLSDIGAGFNKEWVELFNNGPTAVSLGGWVFADIQDQHAASPLPGGTMLAPNQALVLVGDAATFDAQWGPGISRIELDNFPTLANSPSASNEVLAIIDSAGDMRDAVNYDDENGWPTDISDGPSIYVLPEFLTAAANDIGANWASSTPLIDGASYSLASPYGEKASPGVVATEPTIFPPFLPSPDAAWSTVIFPDTQNYVKTESHLPLLVDMTAWVRDNHAAWNVQVLLQEGDIVNKNNNENPSSGENPSTLQWQNAQATMSLLNGEIPYIMNVGNHDTGVNDAEDRSTRFNDFFSPADNPLVDPQHNGILQGVMQPGRLENAYFEVNAPDGRQLLIFSLAWAPTAEQLNWANRIVSQSKYEDHTAVLLVHNYLASDGLRNSDGEAVWDALIKENDNFELVLSGHVGGDGTGYLASTGDHGNQVHQMVFNTQFEGNGGNGWMRVLEFLEDGRTVRVRTYSPSFGYLRDDLANAFSFELTPLHPADFDGDGDVDGSDLLVWKAGLGQFEAGWIHGDSDGDFDVDGNDFLQWQRGYLGGVVAAKSAVRTPEPSTLALVAALLMIAAGSSARTTEPLSQLMFSGSR